MQENTAKRYVVDTGYISNIFKSKLREILNSHLFDHKVMSEKIDFIYKESLNQMFMVLDNNLDDYLLKIVGMPNPNYFAHIDEFKNSQTYGQFHDIFKEVALLLFHTVNSKVNMENSRVEYLLEAVGLDYIILIKYYKGDN